MASKKANTKFFYVVDGDSQVLSTFDFSFKPEVWDEKYVHIWHAFNPAIGIDYGYGGIKLFNKSFFKNININNLDFSTTLTTDIKIFDEIASITTFNSSPKHAFRGAVRETVKLTLTIKNKNTPENEILDAKSRLESWLNPIQGTRFSAHIEAGTIHGMEMATKSDKSFSEIMSVNDTDAIPELLLASSSGIYDTNVDPTPSQGNPMKEELFFTTRVASILYDPFVQENLFIDELRDALSDGQLLSKNWLVEVLTELIDSGRIESYERRPISIAILGGWIGTLALMINVRELPVEITSIDIDERANLIAAKLNYGFKFNTKVADMYDIESIDYSDYDVIINTSSEHIPDIAGWRDNIPDDKIIIVQNNNFIEGEGHISNVNSSSELSELLNLNELYYVGTKTFKQYDRYMMIGKT